MINPGKRFENDFKESCIKSGFYLHRLRDNAMSYTESETSYTKENPYDFLLYSFPNLIALELKHTKQSSMSIQRTNEDGKNKMIKKHQIKGLAQAAEYFGVKAGFIFSFYLEKTQQEFTFYLSIENFNKFLLENDKKSISLEDIMKYGGIKIDQTLKRTHYSYNIDDLINILRNETIKKADNFK